LAGCLQLDGLKSSTSPAAQQRTAATDDLASDDRAVRRVRLRGRKECRQQSKRRRDTETAPSGRDGFRSEHEQLGKRRICGCAIRRSNDFVDQLFTQAGLPLFVLRRCFDDISDRFWPEDDGHCVLNRCITSVFSDSAVMPSPASG
jgi:hypothetical protein